MDPTPEITSEATATPTPTQTLTPTPTYTPTLDIYLEVTIEAQPGEGARVIREISVADYWVILLLFAILLSMWVMYLLERWRGKGG